MPKLDGKRIAFLATDGVEEVELTRPRDAVREAGAEAVLVSPSEVSIQAFDHLDKSRSFPVDVPIERAEAADFDALVLPGGVANPDRLRTDDRAVAFVRAFVDAGKPIGVICHGPWTLVEAGALRGRTLTSYPSLRTDVVNAGGHWVDEGVVVDEGIVSSRHPGDLPAFCEKLVEEIAEGRHERSGAATGTARAG